VEIEVHLTFDAARSNIDVMGTRASTVGVVALILVPLFLTVVVKYAPVFTAHPKITSVSVVPPHLYGPKEFDYMEEDIPARMREGLTGISGVTILPSPAVAESRVGEDVAKVATTVGGADALIMTTVTVDSGLIQLNVEIIDPKTKRILYSTPFQSSKDNYPDMMRAAAAAVKRELQR